MSKYVTCLRALEGNIERLQMASPRNLVIRCIRTIMKKPSRAGPNPR
jgi:hypothetical protein